MDKPPAFQFYPKDWLGSDQVGMMTLAEQGAYLRILCYCWLNEDCGIKADKVAIATLIGWDNEEPGLLENVLLQFEERAGRLYNPRLLEERQKIDQKRLSASESGKAGARARWGRHDFAKLSPSGRQCDRNADAMAKNSSSSSTSNKPPIVPLSESDIPKFRKAYPKSDRLRAIVVETEYVEALERGHNHEEIMAGVERMKRSGRAMRYMPAAPDFLRENRFLDDWPSEDSEAEEPIEEVWARRHPPEPEWMKGRGPWCTDWTEEEEAERQRKLREEGDDAEST